MDYQALMQMKQDYAVVIDQFGLVQPEAGTTSDNGIRFSVEAILAGYPEPKKLMTAIKNCQKEPGLLVRAPDRLNKQEAIDDYTAALAASYLVDGRVLANDIYEYGKKHYGVYLNGTDWGYFHRNPFLWRNPTLYFFSKFAATGKIGFVGNVVLAGSILFSAMSMDQDSKILSWFQIRCLKGKSWLIDKSIKFWECKLKRQYGDGGIGEVLSRYYDPMHGLHPNSKYLMGVNE